MTSCLFLCLSYAGTLRGVRKSAVAIGDGILYNNKERVFLTW